MSSNKVACTSRTTHRNKRSLPVLHAHRLTAIMFVALVGNAVADPTTCTLKVVNEFGPLTDVGRTHFIVPPCGNGGATHFDCHATVVQNGSQFLMTTTLHSGAPTSRDFCDTVGSAYVGPLIPGQYQVGAQVIGSVGKTGEFSYLSQFSITVCFATSPPDDVEAVVEYYNTVLDHYFMTPNAAEQAAIEAGKVGLGWVRTGRSFRAIVQPGCLARIQDGVFHPIYRFTGVPNIGPNSHFFTASQDECAVVRDRLEWHWEFEGAPFWANEVLQGGGCPSGTKVLYRAYNNGKGGTPNHRYSTDFAVIDSMVAQGWVSEGAAMCVLQ